MKTWQTALLAANIALAVAVLAIAATLVFRYPARISPIEDNTLSRLDDQEFSLLNARLDEVEYQNRELKNQIEETKSLLQELSGKSSKAEISSRIPAKYAEQVNSFFKSASAQDLLSEKAVARGVWKFSKPVFIRHDIVKVDYSLQDKTETLLLSVGILDYSELEFKVMWDSLELQK